ncbi:MAG: GNAT family protein [Acidimicrobiales bacterium]
MASLVDLWPLFGLRIATPRLELRLPTDDDLAELVELSLRGIHDPATMPFGVPWTDVPSPRFEWESLQHHWGGRVGLSAESWRLGFGVRCDGELVGIQSIQADTFPLLRTAETGSWLGLAHHGRGIGTEMRRAVVHFAFEALGALAVTSSAFVDNAASQRVSLAVGYEPNGRRFNTRRNQRGEQIWFLLTRERWLATRTDLPVTVTGWEPCRAQLGL